jgi:hypothetical protein
MTSSGHFRTHAAQKANAGDLSLDDLVGNSEQTGRERETERRSGLKVDDEFKFSWLKNR